MNRVVVTGIGFISPLGNTIDKLTKNLKIGKNALNEISLFDNKNSKVKFACQADIKRINNYRDRNWWTYNNRGRKRESKYQGI